MRASCGQHFFQKKEACSSNFVGMDKKGDIAALLLRADICREGGRAIDTKYVKHRVTDLFLLLPKVQPSRNQSHACIGRVAAFPRRSLLPTFCCRPEIGWDRPCSGW